MNGQKDESNAAELGHLKRRVEELTGQMEHLKRRVEGLTGQVVHTHWLAINAIAAVKPCSDALLSRISEATPSRPLTLRERQVCKLLLAGKANKEIASVLGIAEGTVKFHIVHILDKHDVSTRTELLAKYLPFG